jgi:CheY-like chemotaxis protein
MQTKNTLLWIDDDIDDFSEYVQALGEAGFDVATAKNAADGIKVLNRINPKVVLADILMPPPDGIEMLRRMHDIKPNTVYAVFSSFLYLQKYREQLKLLSFPIQLLDKDFPNVHDETFVMRFIDPIKKLFSQGVTYTIQDSAEPHPMIEGQDPFGIEFAEFMSLPIADKDRLADKAEKLARHTIERAFARGSIWVLLCGNINEISAQAEVPKNIMSEEEIISLAQRKNRAPYQFCQSLMVEDYWTTCSSDVSMKD